jgi:hypothetical protein
VPQAFRERPIELDQSQNIEKDSEAIAQALQDSKDGKAPPIYMPSSMAQQQHKLPPWKVAWLGSVIAVVHARLHENRRLQALHNLDTEKRNIPVKTMIEHGQEFASVPTQDEVANPPQKDPLQSDKITADDMNRLARQHRARLQTAAEQRTEGTMHSLQEISDRITQLNGFTCLKR